jgi:hypothetical protein
MTLPDGTSWLTLGGYMASDKFWSEFEKGWVREVLQKREPHAPYLHATDTVSGNGLFKGWEFERRRQLIMDAVDFLQWLPKKAFCATVCSIDETACKKLKAEGCAVEGAHYIWAPIRKV